MFCNVYGYKFLIMNFYVKTECDESYYIMSFFHFILGTILRIPIHIEAGRYQENRNTTRKT